MSYSKDWTTRERSLVEKYYPTHGSDVSKWPERIDRSRSAVSSYASKHGILRSRDTYSHITSKQVPEIREAIYVIANHVRVSPRALVHDLCVMRKRGEL